MAWLTGKKLILLGEDGGVSEQALEACLAASGAEVVFSASEECPD